MQVWKGWMATSATTSVPAVTAAPTWSDWCARQRCILSGENQQQACQQERSQFSDRELARLSFVRWLYQSGCLDPAQNDNVRK